MKMKQKQENNKAKKNFTLLCHYVIVIYDDVKPSVRHLWKALYAYKDRLYLFLGAPRKTSLPSIAAPLKIVTHKIRNLYTRKLSSVSAS